MEDELEGIDLETINPNNEAILLPNVSEEDAMVEDVEENISADNEPEIEVDEDSEKQKSLQRGVNKERQLRKAAEKKNKELEARIKALEEANQQPVKTQCQQLKKKVLINLVIINIIMAGLRMKISVSRRRKYLRNRIYDERTRILCRSNMETRAFTRNRKITFSDLLLLTLNKQGRNVSFEIRDYEINKKGEQK